MALCGSHIAHAARLAYLVHMVGSWYIQYHAVPLRISISCAGGLEESVRDTMGSLLHMHPGLTVSVSQQPLTQGQHYQRLARQLQQEGCDGRDTWLLLTDDDDLWHQQRSLMYAGTLQAALAIGLPPPGELLSVCSSRCINAAEKHSVRSAFCVTKLHRAGAAPHKSMLARGPERVTAGEAWCYSMRLCTLAQFFAAAEPCVVSHVYWDMCLVKFLRGENKYKTCFHTDEVLGDACWMYYYRRDEGVGPASRLLASSNSPAKGDPLASLAFQVRNTLEVYCAMFNDFDAKEFTELVEANVPHPGLKPAAANLCRGMAWERLLSDTQSIYYKLLHSPRCLQSDHA